MPSPSINVDARKKAIQEKAAYYAQDFFGFTRDVLGYKLLKPEIHRDVCAFMAQGKGDGSWRYTNIRSLDISPDPKLAYNNEEKFLRKRFLADPRSHFKTTIVSVSYNLWRWVKNPYLRIMIGGAADSRSFDILREICSHITDNDIFIGLYGNMCSKGMTNGLWKRDSITLRDPATGKAVPYQNMPSGLIVGMETSIVGKHPDIVDLDDLVCRENVENKDLLEKPKTYIKFLIPALDRGTELNIVGTRYHEEDMYALMLRDPTCDVFIRSALNEDGTVLFPERITKSYLQQMELDPMMGPYQVSCQYYNNPISDQDAMFKRQWIDDCLVEPLRDIDRSKYHIIMAVDPAISVSKIADHTGYCVIGMDQHGQLWVFEAGKRKMANDLLIKELKRIYTKWQPQAMVVEETVFSELLKPLITRVDSKFGETIRYRGYRQDNQRSKDFRIRALTPLIEFRRVFISKDQQDFVSELRRYCGRKSDKDNILDAFEICVAQLRPPAPDKQQVDVAESLRKQRQNEDRDIRPSRNKQTNILQNVFMY